MDDHLIRPDDHVDDDVGGEVEDAAATQGFGSVPQLVPPRPDVALTTLVTGVTLAICIVVTATAMAFGRGQGSQVQNGEVQIGHAGERSVAIAAHPLHSRS
jgi:hypothetical protein